MARKDLKDAWRLRSGTGMYCRSKRQMKVDDAERVILGCTASSDTSWPGSLGEGLGLKQTNGLV